MVYYGPHTVLEDYQTPKRIFIFLDFGSSCGSLLVGGLPVGRASPPHRPNIQINRRKYFVPRLGDPNPNLGRQAIHMHFHRPILMPLPCLALTLGQCWGTDDNYASRASYTAFPLLHAREHPQLQFQRAFYAGPRPHIGAPIQMTKCTFPFVPTNLCRAFCSGRLRVCLLIQLVVGV